ncbi:hypothetical protein BANRA_00752 [Klebsiella pneumoniae]|nr:hypothetical protein BANRA_00752 [Klebsiella pneumoniae]
MKYSKILMFLFVSLQGYHMQQISNYHLLTQLKMSNIFHCK